MKKGRLCMLVFILMVVSVIVPISATMLSEKSFRSPARGDMLYVGGNGPGNYTTIQAAIDNATGGDTIYVYHNASPYKEHIVLNNQLHLVGEDPTTTIINATYNGDAITVTADGCTIQNFTIRDAMPTQPDDRYGILIQANDTLVQNNIFINDCFAVMASAQHFSPSAIQILNNEVYDGRYFGLSVYGSDSTIAHNILSNPGELGIVAGSGDNDLVTENIVSGSTDFGIALISVSSCNVSLNNITHNIRGLELIGASQIEITKNNFIQNRRDTRFISYVRDLKHNQWSGNYWDKGQFGSSHIIFGWLTVIKGFELPLIPWINLDNQPAQTPFTIP